MFLTRALDSMPPGLARRISWLQWRVPLMRRLYVAIAKRHVDRDAVVKTGPAKGLRFNGRGSRNAGFVLGTYELELQTVLAQLAAPGAVVFDIGANIGFLTMLAASRVGPTGRVICFDPLPQNVEQIRYNAQLNGFDNVHVIQEAIGDSNAQVNLQTSAECGWGRIGDCAAIRPDEFTGDLAVAMKTLGEAVTSHRLPSPDLIKIDIEGAETKLLAGSIEFFKNHRPTMLIELHGTNGEVADLLDTIGYQSVVIRDSRDIRAALWSAQIIACPSEKEAEWAECRELAKRSA